MYKKILFVFLFLGFKIVGFSQDLATISHENNVLSIKYGNNTVFTGRIADNGAKITLIKQKQVINGAIFQIMTISSTNSIPIELDGTVAGSEEAIACESEPGEGNLKVVRQVVGKSSSLLNNAVYERKADWLLSFDKIITKPVVRPGENNNYQIKVTGQEIAIRFRPHYYQKHRGLSYFNSAGYSVWKKPVVGWCSWFAYFNAIKEADIKETADVISEKLKPFGLEYLQMDDGYQQLPIGMPDTWLKPNEKFPSGLKNLAAYIKSKGLKPAIWTNVSFADSAGAYKNKALFVLDKNGNPAKGNWIGYIMDGSNPQAIRQLVSPVYAGLNDDGFDYIKLDALRHYKYEGFNSYKEFFAAKKVNRDDAYRAFVKDVRDKIGPQKFLLACWGIRPELVGLADGCRIGNDGYSYAGLAQFNSYNNIVWRNDPDHIVLSEKEAYRSCMATSLTGSLFMVTDKPDKYRNSPLIEAARRSIPVLYTQPGQVYDVDPSRSALIAQADIEMSGSGPRSFDASSTTTTGLFELEVNKPFESWVVLGRVDDRDKVLPFRDLGLDENKEYLAFEFWTKRFEGTFKKRFTPGAIDTAFNCQAFCFREKLDHPQLLATNRHISCGGYDINSLQWQNNSLSGESQVVGNDDYTIYIHENSGFEVKDVALKNAELISNEKDGEVRRVTMRSKADGVVYWYVSYK